MRILVDGRDVPETSPGGASLNERYRQVVRDQLDAGRTIVSVSLDGRVLDDAELSRVLDGTGAGERLDLETMALAALVGAALREVARHLEPLRTGARNVMGALDRSDRSAALESLKPVLEIWQGICEAVDKVCVISGVGAEEDLDGVTLDGEERRIGSAFAGIEKALRNEDWGTLGDLLEYELLGAADRWEKLVATLRRKLESHGEA